jgi:hydrogenase expression/formation protein HypC
MCLAIPGRLIEIIDEGGLPMGRIDYAGTIQTACLAYVPEAVAGQYVLVHAGFALSVVDEEEAHKTLALWNELIAAEADRRPEAPEPARGSADDARPPS